MQFLAERIADRAYRLICQNKCVCRIASQANRSTSAGEFKREGSSRATHWCSRALRARRDRVVFAVGSLQGTPTIQSPFGTMQGPGQVTVNINGWNGTFTPLGMKIPNWVLVVVAILVAVFAWPNTSARASDIQTTS